MGSRIKITAAQFARQLKETYAQYEAYADDKLIAMFVKKFTDYEATYAGNTAVSVTFEPVEEQPASAAQVIQNGIAREEPRILVQLPVRIWGMDAFGLPFSQSASTVSISPKGARVSGMRSILATEDVVGLSHEGQKGRFRIAWVGQLGTSQAGQIGVRALDLERSLWSAELSKQFTNSKTQERRFAPRYRCEATITILQQGAQYPIYAPMTDISLGGCYVDILMPLPPGTRASLLIALPNATIRTMAKVCTSHGGVGMGLRFEDMREADRQVLQEALSKLRPI